jgi:hypothetical protein
LVENVHYLCPFPGVVTHKITIFAHCYKTQ